MSSTTLYPPRPSDAPPVHGAPERRPVAPRSVLPASRPVGDDVDAPAFDLRLVRDVAGFGWRAVAKRQSRLAGAVFAVGCVATALAVAVVPRTYVIESTIVAQRNLVMPALSNPQRAVPADGDAPTRLAEEAVLSRENLLGLIREVDLLRVWPEVRPLAERLVEGGRELARGPRSEAERVDALVEELEKRLWVKSDEGTVTIGFAWPHAPTALRVVEAAQRNFLERRHATELAMIGESIGILEKHVDEAHVAIERSVEDLKQGAPRAVSGVNRLSIGAPRPVPRRVLSDEALALQATHNAKLTVIRDLEASRNQRLAALQTRLVEVRNTYGRAHPEITTVEESIRALSADSPQLASLRAEERQLRARLETLGAFDPAPAAPAGAGIEPLLARATLDRLARANGDTTEDPRVTYAKSRLKIAVNGYEDLLDRLEGARIERETARAAFKYRYSVVDPPQLPKRPAKPQVALLIVGGVALAAMLGVFAAVVADLASGRVHEAWQVERQLGLPVLGAVRRL